MHAHTPKHTHTHIHLEKYIFFKRVHDIVPAVLVYNGNIPSWVISRKLVLRTE